ncbi:hypothetical protein OXX59_005814 [Metschnikowia pulcherrima]
MEPKLVRTRFEKGVIHSKDFSLSTQCNSPEPIQAGWFTWRLNPAFPEDGKRVILECTVCSKVFVHSWPINTAILKNHLDRDHSAIKCHIMGEALD